MTNKKKNEVHVSKLITEMPKLEMSHNARLVLYTVLKKMWQMFRNRENYKQKIVLLPEDLEAAQKPINLSMGELKPLFRKNTAFKSIKEHVIKIPYEAIFKTNIDLHGKKRNELMDTKIALFIEVQVSDKRKEITFTPAPRLLNYIEALKTFARVDITEMKKLQGNYQIRGYELICQNNYLDNNNNKLVDDEARKIKIEDFRRYFGVPDGYAIGDIDKRVLKPLKRAIDKHTKYNIIAIKKFKLDSNDKKRVTHYRIDVEYKEEYLQIHKEKKNHQLTESDKDNIDNYDNNTTETTAQEFFEKVWNLYPLKKGKADIKIDDMNNLQELGYEIIKTCIDRYKDYIKEKEKEGFNQSLQGGYKFFTKGYIDYLDENYTPYKAKQNKNGTAKPEQATNFEQREYDDEFFDGLYDNF